MVLLMEALAHTYSEEGRTGALGPAVTLLKALSDETRLRIVGVLGREPLHVNELLEILSMGQSRVSRHLRILSDAGLVDGQREGTRIYYRISPEAKASDFLNGILKLLSGGGDPAVSLPGEIRQDMARLGLIIKNRKRASLEHFEREGADQETLQQGLVDAAYYRRKIVALLPERPGVTVDLGCGSGELARLLAEHTNKLVCVDQSPNMLDLAREVCPLADFRIGSVEHLPLSESEADTVVSSMVLHHLPDPEGALREIARVLKPGGRLIIADLVSHNLEIMRTRLADFWLGFEPGLLYTMVENAGLTVEDEGRGNGEGELECVFIRAVKKPPGQNIALVKKNSKGE